VEHLVNLDFFKRDDVLSIARELLGKCLISKFGNKKTAGIITETEAYAGERDRASHAFGGRRTKRTEVMYQDAGTLYIYLCYGIHSLLNIVTNKSGIPHAILIRSVYPIEGLEIIQQRRGKSISPRSDSCIGPGNLSKGLGVSLKQNGIMINQGPIYLADRKINLPDQMVHSGPRIGVDYAGKDAALPYRFYVKHNTLKNLDLMSG